MRESRPSIVDLRAFTLVELLIVITVIVLLLGAIGLALRGRDPAMALRASQSVLASLAGGARGQAAMIGRNAALLIHADPTQPERYLRVCVIAVRNAADTAWVPTSTVVTLSDGVGLLPKEGPTADMVESISAWNRPSDGALLKSTALESTTVSLDIDDTGPLPSEQWWAVVFTPLGTVTQAGDLPIAPMALQPPGAASPVMFSRPTMVRGLALSQYGAVSLINDVQAY